MREGVIFANLPPVRLPTLCRHTDTDGPLHGVQALELRRSCVHRSRSEVGMLRLGRRARFALSPAPFQGDIVMIKVLTFKL